MFQLKSVIDGVISGIILAFFLKMVEEATTYQVYTLLLNVDYIPVLNRYDLPEIVEALLHLVISILLVACLQAVVIRKKITSTRQIILWSMVSCLFIGLALFPTTVLSNRTPSLTSIPAWSYWLLGHLIYGMIVGYLLRNAVK